MSSLNKNSSEVLRKAGKNLGNQPPSPRGPNFPSLEVEFPPLNSFIPTKSQVNDNRNFKQTTSPNKFPNLFTHEEILQLSGTKTDNNLIAILTYFKIRNSPTNLFISDKKWNNLNLQEKKFFNSTVKDTVLKPFQGNNEISTYIKDAFGSFQSDANKVIPRDFLKTLDTGIATLKEKQKNNQKIDQVALEKIFKLNPAPKKNTTSEKVKTETIEPVAQKMEIVEPPAPQSRKSINDLIDQINTPLEQGSKLTEPQSINPKLDINFISSQILTSRETENSKPKSKLSLNSDIASSSIEPTRVSSGRQKLTINSNEGIIIEPTKKMSNLGLYDQPNHISLVNEEPKPPRKRLQIFTSEKIEAIRGITKSEISIQTEEFPRNLTINPDGVKIADVSTNMSEQGNIIAEKVEQNNEGEQSNIKAEQNNEGGLNIIKEKAEQNKEGGLNIMEAKKDQEEEAEKAKEEIAKLKEEAEKAKEAGAKLKEEVEKAKEEAKEAEVKLKEEVEKAKEEKEAKDNKKEKGETFQINALEKATLLTRVNHAIQQSLFLSDDERKSLQEVAKKDIEDIKNTEDYDKIKKTLYTIENEDKNKAQEIQSKKEKEAEDSVFVTKDGDLTTAASVELTQASKVLEQSEGATAKIKERIQERYETAKADVSNLRDKVASLERELSVLGILWDKMTNGPLSQAKEDLAHAKIARNEAQGDASKVADSDKAALEKLDNITTAALKTGGYVVDKANSQHKGLDLRADRLSKITNTPKEKVISQLQRPKTGVQGPGL